MNNIKIEEIIRLIKKKKHKRNPLLLKWLIDLMIEKHYFIEDPSILKIYYSSRSIAHIQVMSLKWKTNNTDILKLQDSVGNTVAHYQARYTKWTTNDKNILCLENNKGWTVAHELASNGWKPKDEKIFDISDKNGITVRHVHAEHNCCDVYEVFGSEYLFQYVNDYMKKVISLCGVRVDNLIDNQIYWNTLYSGHIANYNKSIYTKLFWLSCFNIGDWIGIICNYKLGYEDVKPLAIVYSRRNYVNPVENYIIPLHQMDYKIIKKLYEIGYKINAMNKEERTCLYQIMLDKYHWNF